MSQHTAQQRYHFFITRTLTGELDIAAPTFSAAKQFATEALRQMMNDAFADIGDERVELLDAPPEEGVSCEVTFDSGLR